MSSNDINPRVPRQTLFSWVYGLIAFFGILAELTGHRHTAWSGVATALSTAGRYMGRIRNCAGRTLWFVLDLIVRVLFAILALLCWSIGAICIAGTLSIGVVFWPLACIEHFFDCLRFFAPRAWVCNCYASCCRLLSRVWCFTAVNFDNVRVLARNACSGFPVLVSGCFSRIVLTISTSISRSTTRVTVHRVAVDEAASATLDDGQSLFEEPEVWYSAADWDDQPAIKDVNGLGLIFGPFERSATWTSEDLVAIERLESALVIAIRHSTYTLPERTSSTPANTPALVSDDTTSLSNSVVLPTPPGLPTATPPTDDISIFEALSASVSSLGSSLSSDWTLTLNVTEDSVIERPEHWIPIVERCAARAMQVGVSFGATVPWAPGVYKEAEGTARFREYRRQLQLEGVLEIVEQEEREMRFQGMFPMERSGTLKWMDRGTARERTDEIREREKETKAKKEKKEKKQKPWKPSAGQRTYDRTWVEREPKKTIRTVLGLPPKEEKKGVTRRVAEWYWLGGGSGTVRA